MIDGMDLEEFTLGTVFRSAEAKKEMCDDIATALRFFNENEFNGSIQIMNSYLDKPYYIRKEHNHFLGEERLYYRSFEGVTVDKCGIHPNINFTCWYSYATHQFTKILPNSGKKICVNLTDYSVEPLVRTMIDDVLQAEFPEHTQKLFHDNFSYCNPYRISVNTILNKDNKTVEDVITQRGKYPLPPMKEMTFLTGMVARNAAKTLSGSEYSEFLTFLSERPGDFCYVHPAYSCLEEITISAIRYFRYKNTQKAKKESQRIPLEPDAEQCA